MRAPARLGCGTRVAVTTTASALPGSCAKAAVAANRSPPPTILFICLLGYPECASRF